MDTNAPEMLSDIQKKEMVGQIRDHLNCFTNADFARKMGISPQNAYVWQNRGAFNAELVAAKCPDISGDWLLTGQGPMLKKDRDRKESPATSHDNVHADSLELRKLTEAIAVEQKLTAKAQEQADKLIGLLHSITKLYGPSVTEEK